MKKDFDVNDCESPPPPPPIHPPLPAKKKCQKKKKNWDIHRTFKMADPEDAAIPSVFLMKEESGKGGGVLKEGVFCSSIREKK